jgi:hypothetical protein
MCDAPFPAPGYERLTIRMDIESGLLEELDTDALTILMTQDAQRQIKEMIEVRKNA